MRRYDKSRFLAFGVLQVANTIGLALYGLDLSTSGSGRAAGGIPLLVGLMAACLLMATLAAVRRGRDINLPVWMTVVLFWMAGPLLPLLIAYFAFAKPHDDDNRFGPPAPPADASMWFGALFLLAAPWAVFFFAVELM